MNKMNNFTMEIDADIILNKITNLIENGEKSFGLLPISDIDLSDIDDRMDHVYDLETILVYDLMDYFKDDIYKYLDGILYRIFFTRQKIKY